MTDHHTPLWQTELEASGDYQGRTQCYHCKESFPNSQIKFGARSPIRPSEHYCTTCFKRLGIIEFEDFDPSVQNFFGA